MRKVFGPYGREKGTTLARFGLMATYAVVIGVGTTYLHVRPAPGL